jgi:Cytochrome P450
LRSGDYAAFPDPRERDHFSFGAGRRICPGIHLSENSLFITLARILWAFKIEGVGDVDVNAYETGSITVAKVFKAKFTPWDNEKVRLIDEEWKLAQEQGYTIGGMVIKQ